MKREDLGRWGEGVAAMALQARGYKVLCRNFRGSRGGEVDLVCRHGQVLVFAEVKTRASGKYGRPADAVTRNKQHLVRRGAKEWLSRLSVSEVPCRFDVVEVVAEPGVRPRVNVIAGAFGDS